MTAADSSLAAAERSAVSHDELASAVVIAIHRLAKQATLYTTENQAQLRQIEDTRKAVAEYGRRTGRNPKLFFTERAVFVGGRLLYGGRQTYEAAMELGSTLRSFELDEMAIGFDVPAEDLRAFQISVAAAVRQQGPSPAEEPYKRIRLRHGRPPGHRPGLQDDDLPPEQALVRLYATAIVVMRRFLEGMQRGRYRAPVRVRRIAQRMAELSALQSPAFLGATTLYNARHEHAGRAVNAALLTLGMARQLTDDPRMLTRLAMAALLYDIGLPRVAGTDPTGDERVGLALPNVGVDQLLELPAATAAVSTALSGMGESGMTYTVLAYEALHLNHREHVDPLYQGARPAALEARIVAVARRFTELLADPDEELDADAALLRILRENDALADKTAARLLMAAIGLVPTGTLVELSTGAIGQVVKTASDANNFSFPVVRPLVDASGGTISKSGALDLSRQRNRKGGVRIVRVVAMATEAEAREAHQQLSAIHDDADDAPYSTPPPADSLPPDDMPEIEVQAASAPPAAAVARDTTTQSRTDPHASDVEPPPISAQLRGESIMLGDDDDALAVDLNTEDDWHSRDSGPVVETLDHLGNPAPPPDAESLPGLDELSSAFAHALVPAPDTSRDIPNDDIEHPPTMYRGSEFELHEEDHRDTAVDPHAELFSDMHPDAAPVQADPAVDVEALDWDDDPEDIPSMVLQAVIDASKDDGIDDPALNAFVNRRGPGLFAPRTPASDREDHATVPRMRKVGESSLPPRRLNRRAIVAGEGQTDAVDPSALAPQDTWEDPPKISSLPAHDSVPTLAAAERSVPSSDQLTRVMPARPSAGPGGALRQDLTDVLPAQRSKRHSEPDTEPRPATGDAPARAALAPQLTPELEARMRAAQASAPPAPAAAQRRVSRAPTPRGLEWLRNKIDGRKPTAQGHLKKTPLLHLLVYSLDRSLTGTTMLVAPDASTYVIYFDDGVPCKVRTSSRVAPLDRVLGDLRLVDETTLQKSLLAVSKSGELHGEYLLRKGILDEDTLRAVLARQLMRKIEFMFQLPPNTRYAYFDNINLLDEYGGRQRIAGDALALIMSGVRALGGSRAIDQTLEKVQRLPLRLHRHAAISRLNLQGRERAVVDLLRARPLTLEELVQRRLAPERVVRHVIYALVITRSLKIGAKSRMPLGHDKVMMLPPLPARRQHSSTPIAASVSSEARDETPLGSPSPIPVAVVPARRPRTPQARQTTPIPGLPETPPPIETIEDAPVVVHSQVATANSARPKTRIKRRPTRAQQRAMSSISQRTPSPLPSDSPLAVPGRRTNNTPPLPQAPVATTSQSGALTHELVAQRLSELDATTLYEMLGLEQDAPVSAMQTRYFELAKMWHPDRLPAELEDVRDDAGKVFARINEAYQTLSDPDRRRDYDGVVAAGGGTARDREIVERAVDSAMLYQKAEVLFKRGQYDRAEELLQQAVSNDDQEPTYLALLAWVQAHQLGLPPDEESRRLFYRAQISMLNEAMEHDPSFERALYYRGELYKRSGRLDKAMRDFKAVVKLNPHNIDAARAVRLHQRRKEKTRSGGGLFGRWFRKSDE